MKGGENTTYVHNNRFSSTVLFRNLTSSMKPKVRFVSFIVVCLSFTLLWQFVPFGIGEVRNDWIFWPSSLSLTASHVVECQHCGRNQKQLFFRTVSNQSSQKAATTCIKQTPPSSSAVLILPDPYCCPALTGAAVASEIWSLRNGGQTGFALRDALLVLCVRRKCLQISAPPVRSPPCGARSGARCCRRGGTWRRAPPWWRWRCRTWSAWSSGPSSSDPTESYTASTAASEPPAPGCHSRQTKGSQFYCANVEQSETFFHFDHRMTPPDVKLAHHVVAVAWKKAEPEQTPSYDNISQTNCDFNRRKTRQLIQLYAFKPHFCIY